jgi:phosphoenolpyruvate carboxylase
MTVQGETIASHFSNPAIAHRNLEQLINAVLLASAGAISPSGAELEKHSAQMVIWRQTMEPMAAAARQAYLDLVYRTPLLQFWQDVLPWMKSAAANCRGRRCEPRNSGRSR